MKSKLLICIALTAILGCAMYRTGWLLYASPVYVLDAVCITIVLIVLNEATGAYKKIR